MKQTVYTEKEITTLKHLAEYQYLNIPQFLTLGADKHRSNLQTTLSRLVKGKMIDVITFGTTTEKKLPYVYCLLPKGKTTLKDELYYPQESIRMPKSRNSYFKHQYHHREGILNFQIQFNKWIKQTEAVSTVFFNRDFDFTGREPKNKINLNEQQFIIPDLVSMIDIRGRKVLFFGEISMGFDSKLILEKMLNHILVLGTGAAQKKYQHERKGHLITWVFHEEALKRNVMKQMQKDKRFTNVEKLFLMKTTKELEDFFHNWSIFTGESVNFLPF